MNKVKHEGVNQANQDAEMTSRKNQDERFVIKSMAGGLHYYVTNSLDSLLPQDKVMNSYYRGTIGKKPIQQTPVVKEEPVAVKEEPAVEPPTPVEEQPEAKEEELPVLAEPDPTEQEAVTPPIVKKPTRKRKNADEGEGEE